MSIIQNSFKKKPCFVGYLMAGDGGMDRSLEAMLALVEGGVDILEVGVPFSDPVADGITIQQASARALNHQTTLSQILSLIHRFKKIKNIPVILFSYFNPILNAYKKQNNFYDIMKKNGVDGILIVDLPLEEMQEHYKACLKATIDPIFLISPSTPIDRIKIINELGKGMLYYICRYGTTGIKNTLPPNFHEKINAIKAEINLPLVVGFGISNRKMATAVCKHADGFVVGSLFVNAIAENKTSRELTKLVKQIDPRYTID